MPTGQTDRRTDAKSLLYAFARRGQRNHSSFQTTFFTVFSDEDALAFLSGASDLAEGMVVTEQSPLARSGSVPHTEVTAKPSGVMYQLRVMVL